MQSVSLMLFIFCAVIMSLKANVIPKELEDEILEKGTTCLADTEVDLEVLLKTKQGIIEDDPKLKAFFVCLSKNVGVMNEKGDWQIEFMKQKKLDLKLGADADNHNSDEVAQKCMVKKSTPEESVYEALKCIYDTMPEEDKKALKES